MITLNSSVIYTTLSNYTVHVATSKLSQSHASQRHGTIE